MAHARTTFFEEGQPNERRPVPRQYVGGHKHGTTVREAYSFKTWRRRHHSRHLSQRTFHPRDNNGTEAIERMPRNESACRCQIRAARARGGSKDRGRARRRFQQRRKRPSPLLFSSPPPLPPLTYIVAAAAALSPSLADRIQRGREGIVK